MAKPRRSAPGNVSDAACHLARVYSAKTASTRAYRRVRIKQFWQARQQARVDESPPCSRARGVICRLPRAPQPTQPKRATSEKGTPIKPAAVANRRCPYQLTGTLRNYREGCWWKKEKLREVLLSLSAVATRPRSRRASREHQAPRVRGFAISRSDTQTRPLKWGSTQNAGILKCH